MQSELMQRLGVGSLLRLTSLGPMKKEFTFQKLVEETTVRLSHQANTSESGVSSSSTVMSPPHAEVTSSTQVESRSSRVNDLREEPDPIENCGVHCEDSDDVMLIELIEQLPAGRAKMKHTVQQGNDELHVEEGSIHHHARKRKRPRRICRINRIPKKRVRHAVDPSTRRKSFSMKKKAVLSVDHVESCLDDNEEECVNRSSDGECVSHCGILIRKLSCSMLHVFCFPLAGCGPILTPTSYTINFDISL